MKGGTIIPESALREEVDILREQLRRARGYVEDLLSLVEEPDLTTCEEARTFLAETAPAMSDPTPAARHAKVVVEFKRRLAVCEAQTRGPWHVSRSRRGYVSRRSHETTGAFQSCKIAKVFESNGMSWGTDLEAIAAQRTERPSELRGLLEVAQMVQRLWMIGGSGPDLIANDLLAILERAVVKQEV